MSLPIAYGMKKRMAKGGMAHKEDCPGCEMCHGGEMYAKGGRVKGPTDHASNFNGNPHAGVHGDLGYQEIEKDERKGQSLAGRSVRHSNREGISKSSKQNHLEHAKKEHRAVLHEQQLMKKHDRKNLAHGGDVKKGHHDSLKGVHKPVSGQGSGRHPGMSEAGEDYRDSRLGYGEESPSGGQKAKYREDAKAKHHKVISELHQMKKHDRKNLAEGGEVDGEPGLVDIIMEKRKGYSEGGKVANDTGEGAFADEMPNEFDDLVLDDDLDFSYTGKNSGDELGDEREDQDRDDIVSQIMKSRKKKDRLPSPA